MGYAIYEQPTLGRWAGYQVPGICDQGGCETRITRGTDARCDLIYEYRQLRDGEEIEPEDELDDTIEEIEVEIEGCGLFFCAEHQQPTDHSEHDVADATGDHPDWMRHLLEHPSWERWRTEHPDRAETMRGELAGAGRK